MKPVSKTLFRTTVLALLMGNLPALAETQIVSSILPNSRSVLINEPATLFATIINAGQIAAENCRIESDPTTIANFQYATTNPATNIIDGTLDTPVTIMPGRAQTFVISVSFTSPRASFEFQPRFLCDNAPLVPTISGLNSFTLAVSSTPVPDVIALSTTVSADGITTLPQRASAAAFSVATTNLGARADITVNASLSDVTLPAFVALCETNPATSACITPTTPTTETITLNIDQSTTKTFGFFVTSSDDIPFDPARNRVFVRFTDSTGETRGATSVALRSRLRAQDEPLQLVRSIAATSVALPVRAFDRLLSLHREVVAGTIRLADAESNEVLSNCEAFGRASFSFRDVDSSLSLSAGDVVVGDLAGCSLGFGNIASGKVEFRIAALIPELGSNWTLGGSVEIVERIVSSPDQLPFFLEGSYEFSISGTSINISEALASSTNLPFTFGAPEEHVQLSEFSLVKTSSFDTGGVSVNASSRIESESLGGSMFCQTQSLATPGRFIEPSSGELMCTGLNDSKVRLAVVNAVEGQSDLTIDENSDGQFDAVASNVPWFTLGATSLLGPGTDSALPAPVRLSLTATAQRNVSVIDLAYSALTDELFVANFAGLVILQPETLAVIESVPLPGVLDNMTMSADGSTLYLGYDNRPEIQAIDVQTRTLQPAINLGPDGFSGELYADDIALDPTDPQRIAVSLRRKNISPVRAGVALFESGVKLPNVTPDHTGSNRIEFLTNGRLFGFQNDVSDFSLRELEITADGLSNGVALRDFLGSFGADLIAVGELLTVSERAPRFIDYDANRVVGQLTTDIGATDGALAIDPVRQQAYYVGSTIDTFELENFTRTNQTNTNLTDTVVDTALTALHLIVAEENRLSVYRREQLTGQAIDTCAAVLRAGISHYDCPMHGSVYNPETNELLVSVGSSAGSIGNSIAVIDPQTAAISRFIPVGSEPGDIDLSADKASVFVGLRGSNVVAEVILATDNVAYSDAILRRQGGLEPLFVSSLGASPTNPGDLITFATDDFDRGEIHFITNGVPVENSLQLTFNDLQSLVFSENNSSRAFATTFESLSILTLDSGTITNETSVSGLLSGYIARGDGLLFSTSGQRLDPATLISDAPFAPIAAQAIGYDSLNKRVLFLQSQGVLTVHDANSGSLVSSIFVPGADALLYPPPKITVSPSGVFLTSGEQGAWLIPANLLAPID